MVRTEWVQNLWEAGHAGRSECCQFERNLTQIQSLNIHCVDNDYGEGELNDAFCCLMIISTSSECFYLKKIISTESRNLSFQTCYFGYVRDNLYHITLTIKRQYFTDILNMIMKNTPKFFEILLLFKIKKLWSWRYVLEKNFKIATHTYSIIS
jgi:hypothetical protein